MFTFNLDSHLIHISRTSLEKFPESVLYKVLVNGESHELIQKFNDNFIVDADYNIFQRLVSFIRGYQLSPMNEIEMSNLQLSAVLFNIPLVAESKQEAMNTVEPYTESTEQLPTLSEIEYDPTQSIEPMQGGGDNSLEYLDASSTFEHMHQYLTEELGLSLDDISFTESDMNNGVLNLMNKIATTIPQVLSQPEDEVNNDLQNKDEDVLDEGSYEESLSEDFINQLNLDASDDGLNSLSIENTINEISPHSDNFLESDSVDYFSSFKTDIEYDPTDNTRTTYLNLF